MVGTGTFPRVKIRIDNVFTKIMLFQVRIQTKSREVARHRGRRRLAVRGPEPQPPMGAGAQECRASSRAPVLYLISQRDRISHPKCVSSFFW